MGTTPRGIPYPEPTAFVVDGAAAIQALAEEVNAELDGIDTARALLGVELDGRLDTLEARQHVSALVNAAGDLLYGSADDTLTRLAIGSTGQVLTVAGGVPSWAAPAAGALVAKPSDTSRASTITATADPHLTLPVVAGGVYAVTVGLAFTGSSSRVGLSWPTDTVGRFTIPTSTGNTTPPNGTAVTGWPDAGLGFGLILPTVAGNASVIWAQGSSSGTPTVAKAGSFLKLERIA